MTVFRIFPRCSVLAKSVYTCTYCVIPFAAAGDDSGAEPGRAEHETLELEVEILLTKVFTGLSAALFQKADIDLSRFADALTFGTA